MRTMKLIYIMHVARWELIDPPNHSRHSHLQQYKPGSKCRPVEPVLRRPQK